MWLCLPRTGLLWGTVILFKMMYIAWLLCCQWHPHTVVTQPLIIRYSVNIPYPFPPKTLPTSSFFLPIQCNIAPKINIKRYFKLIPFFAIWFEFLVQITFVNTFMPFLQCPQLREKLIDNEMAMNWLADQFPKYTKYFLQSSPALGPGHVDCQWGENGSRRRRGGSQQAYSKQALKARALFLPLLNGFLALDPQFQRQYCFRQQSKIKRQNPWPVY